MKILRSLVLLLFLCGCSGEATITEHRPLGKIVSAQMLQSGYSSTAKTVVNTERYTVVTLGHNLIEIGPEADLLTLSNGNRYLRWEGSQFMFYVPQW